MVRMEEELKTLRHAAKLHWSLIEEVTDMHRRSQACALVNHALICALVGMAREQTRDSVIGEFTDRLAQVRLSDPDPRFREYVDEAMQDTLAAVGGGSSPRWN